MKIEERILLIFSAAIEKACDAIEADRSDTDAEVDTLDDDEDFGVDYDDFEDEFDDYEDVLDYDDYDDSVDVDNSNASWPNTTTPAPKVAGWPNTTAPKVVTKSVVTGWPNTMDPRMVKPAVAPRPTVGDFKVGDRVKVVDDNRYWNGVTGVVSHIGKSCVNFYPDPDPIQKLIDVEGGDFSHLHQYRSEGKGAGFFPRNLEIIPAEPKVTPKVTTKVATKAPVLRTTVERDDSRSRACVPVALTRDVKLGVGRPVFIAKRSGNQPGLVILKKAPKTGALSTYFTDKDGNIRLSAYILRKAGLGNALTIKFRVMDNKAGIVAVEG